MPLRLNAKQLRDLIEEIETNGGDASVLSRELEALEPEAKHVPQIRRDSRFREDEETVEERLTRRVGDLFPNGIPLQEILDYDYRFTLPELRAMCKEVGLSLSGDKKELAAKLIANSVKVGDEDAYKGWGI